MTIGTLRRTVLIPGLALCVSALVWGCEDTADEAAVTAASSRDIDTAVRPDLLPIKAPTAVAPEPTAASFGEPYRWIGWYALSYTPSWNAENLCPAPIANPDLPEIAAGLKASRLFSKQRIVAQLQAGTPGGYSFAQLLAVDSALAILGSPDTLSPYGTQGVYCLYEWNGSPKLRQEAEDALPPGSGGQPSSTWLFPDLPQVVAQQGPTNDELADELSVAYHTAVASQIGTTVMPPRPAWAGKVRVAVLDSSVNQFNGLPGDGVIRHGRDMALLIREVACQQNPTSCKVAIANHLALHMRPDGHGFAKPDYVNGGYFGTVGRFSEVLFASVLEWKAADPLAKLIVNMSIGFDIIENSQKDSFPQFQAALAALRWARKAGALPIAAAGNTREGSVPLTGPMWPAKAETMAVPSGTPSSTSTYRPLVYSVAGRDGLAAPINATRSLGKPRLAAYAFSVVSDEGYADGGALGEFDGLGLTGSSVAAAVASAAAAVVWSYRPTLKADDVMAVVYSNGQTIKANADYALSGAGTQTIKLVSVCAAAKAALVGTPTPWSGICPTRANAELVWPQTVVDDALLIGTTVTPSYMGFVVPECDSTASAYNYYATDGAVGSYPCPATQFYNGQGGPQVEPQPNSPICPHCQYFKGNKRLVMLANPDPSNAQYSGVQLRLRGTYASAPTVVRTVGLSIARSYNPYTTVVVNSIGPLGFTVTRADVAGVYAATSTTVSQQIALAP